MRYFRQRITSNDLNRVQRVALKFWTLWTVPEYVGLKELIYLGPSMTHTHKQIDSCPLKGPGFHSLEELLQSNSKDDVILGNLKEREVDYDYFCARDPSRSFVITHKVACSRGTSKLYFFE
jgi:hypothetical protein